MTSSYLDKARRTEAEAERQVRNNRLKERYAANRPWGEKPHVICGEGGKAIILAEKLGSRVSVRCPVPHIDKPIYASRREAFEADLNKYFGGFTSTMFKGGWVSESSETMVEHGRIYELSGMLNQFDINLARMLFCKLGMDLGEEWMHIEVRHFDALHSKVNS